MHVSTHVTFALDLSAIFLLNIYPKNQNIYAGIYLHTAEFPR